MEQPTPYFTPRLRPLHNYGQDKGSEVVIISIHTYLNDSRPLISHG
jgi:hypothetical protein